jgi:hypothetical protein
VKTMQQGAGRKTSRYRFRSEWLRDQERKLATDGSLALWPDGRLPRGVKNDAERGQEAPRRGAKNDRLEGSKMTPNRNDDRNDHPNDDMGGGGSSSFSRDQGASKLAYRFSKPRGRAAAALNDALTRAQSNRQEIISDESILDGE